MSSCEPACCYTRYCWTECRAAVDPGVLLRLVSKAFKRGDSPPCPLETENRVDVMRDVGYFGMGFFFRVGNAYDMETKRNADRELWRLMHVI